MAPAALEIVFPHRSEKCSIFFGERLISEPPLDLFSGASSFAIVSDDIVSDLYATPLQKQLARLAKTHLIVTRHGERNKNLMTVSTVARKLSDAGLDRKGVILALGGGVVGDLAGFVASIFKRGVRYFQFPTTLLAQVDSSIGGKCGVDANWGKNQLGTFYQPAGILIDTGVLDSLPKKEIINGLGEIVKSSIIADREMFDAINGPVEEFYTIRKLKTLVGRTCEIKAKIVEKDEREQGLRRTLNYGHTLGHAIEASADYALPHGKCVILGMICEGWMANKLGIFEERDFAMESSLLLKIKRDWKINTALDREKILTYALLDKKNTSGTIKLSVPEKIGKMHSGEKESYTIPVSKDLLLESLDSLKIK
jgi:3-dehydroquinate synthase